MWTHGFGLLRLSKQLVSMIKLAKKWLNTPVTVTDSASSDYIVLPGLGRLFPVLVNSVRVSA
jgi:hypothetical protein